LPLAGNFLFKDFKDAIDQPRAFARGFESKEDVWTW
jgi:hypothetical protein